MRDKGTGRENMHKLIPTIANGEVDDFHDGYTVI